MSVGASGRIVIEVEPELKRQLYDALKKEDLTLKEWFLRNTKQFLYHGVQLSLDFAEQPTFSAKSEISPQTHVSSCALQPVREARK